VHVRRALLLFAVVLGLAALAASLSRTGDEDPRRPSQQGSTSTSGQETTPRAAPREQTTEEVADGSGGTTVELNAAEDKSSRVEAGSSATVEVAVVEPGQVTIPDLGLTAAADTLTPARFDVLVSSPGRYVIEFTPSAGDETRSAGTLVVTPPSG
jgi:hypothetical protein